MSTMRKGASGARIWRFVKGPACQWRQLEPPWIAAALESGVHNLSSEYCHPAVYTPCGTSIVPTKSSHAMVGSCQSGTILDLPAKLQELSLNVARGRNACYQDVHASVNWGLKALHSFRQTSAFNVWRAGHNNSLRNQAVLHSSPFSSGYGIQWFSSGGLQKQPILRAREEGDLEEEDDDLTVGETSDITASAEESSQMSSLDSQLKGSPRRRQRFLLQKALKIRNIEQEGRPQKRGFHMKVVDVNRTCKVTKGGGILSFTALVVCGNNDGVAGFGKGKSAEISAAVDKAYSRALRNLHYFERYEGHTIYHEKTSKYGKTKIYLWPAVSGTGMRASHTVGGILRLAGFKDVKTKVVGSRHPHNTVKAVFKALSEIETPEELAERQGREMVQARARALA
ncbi:unnamed protein product [Sphagnum jensenii]|uniref:S5 DRBM domain-containing protein n=1 Tax=Sphagnum jensenii TaxID=128206 RepID=A0ABP1BK19_9BRYO